MRSAILFSGLMRMAAYLSFRGVMDQTLAFYAEGTWFETRRKH